MIYIIEFFVFAFIGWITDSLYGSIKHKRKVISGYFKNVPLCPIYGFGGILLLNSFALLHHAPAWLVIVVTTLLIIALEYVGGRLAEFVLEERLWNYSHERYHIHGYISAWHSFLWLVAVTFLYFLIGADAGIYIERLSATITVDVHLQVILVFAVIGVFTWATMKHKKSRLLRRLEKQVAEVLK